MNIATKIEKFIVDELLIGDNRASLDHDLSLITEGILDSLALLRVVMFVEEQFGIQIEDGEVTPENFQSINVIKDYVGSKM